MGVCHNGKTGEPKKQYLSPDEAAPFATGSMHVYPCPNCGYFHVGHPRYGARKKKHDKRYRYAGSRKRKRYT